jgi:hypothetical protein
MRPWLWFAPMMLVCAAAAPAQAGADSDVLTKFGLIGSWAIDCRAPPSMANPFQTFVPSNEGQPTRQLITGNPDYDRIEPISDAILIAPDRLRLSFPQNGITVTIVLVKNQGRVRPLESTTSTGETVVSGGVVQRNGQETSWLEKCPG